MKYPAEAPSSATLLADNLARQSGISRDDIRSEHLASSYAQLHKVFPDAIERRVDDAFLGLPLEAEPGPEPVWGLIVETRAHPALETVLLNVLRYCNIPIQLCHGRDNLDFIRSSGISQLVDQGRVVLTPLNVRGDIGLGYYNQLLLAPRLWAQSRGRGKILLFQTDALCCPGADYTLADFLSQDYIGSRWRRQRPVGLTIDGGSGGFSLRDWSRSVECLERFPPTRWPAGEDGYFAFHLDLMGARVASMDEAGRFSTQDYFDHRSFGCHQVSRLAGDELVAFLTYCPEARDIFPKLQERARIESVKPAGPARPVTTRNPNPDRKSMFLSHKYQFLFFEVPRTGSHSTTGLLNRLDPESPTLVERETHGGGWAFHYLTKAASEHPDYKLMAAHRNPYDRLWSFWKHRKRGGNPEIFRSISWARYIDWVCDPKSVPEIKGAMRDIPITEMLDPDKVDVWLDFHRLETSWQRACGILNLPFQPLPKANASPDHGPMHMAYNAAMAARVAERFAADFEYFGYSPDSWQPGSAIESAT